MAHYRGPHMTSKSGGPCWTRDRGYHQPAPLPAHIQRILLTPAPKPLSPSEASAGTKSVGPLDDQSSNLPPDDAESGE